MHNMRQGKDNVWGMKKVHKENQILIITVELFFAASAKSTQKGERKPSYYSSSQPYNSTSGETSCTSALVVKAATCSRALISSLVRPSTKPSSMA
jgi:nitrogen fixation protein FixH